MSALNKDLKQQFIDLAGALSPENLLCDGELTRDQVIAKKKRLMDKWKLLEAEAGRPVSEIELYR